MRLAPFAAALALAGCSRLYDVDKLKNPECVADQKVCHGACVETWDPTYGCGSPDCTACPAPAPATHMEAICDSTPACAVGCAPGFGDCDGTGGGTSCPIDLSTSSAHCGACGHSCGGAVCAGGLCAAQVHHVAGPGAIIVGLANAAGRVYWTEGGELWSVDAAPGSTTPSMEASGLGAVTDLVVAGIAPVANGPIAFVAGSGPGGAAIFQVQNLGNGSIKTAAVVRQPVAAPAFLSWSGSALWWGDRDGIVGCASPDGVSCPAGGPWAGMAPRVNAIAANASLVFFADGTRVAVMLVATPGTAAASRAGVDASSLALGAGSLFWTVPSREAVGRLPIAGGVPDDSFWVGSGALGSPMQVAADVQGAYWSVRLADEVKEWRSNPGQNDILQVSDAPLPRNVSGDPTRIFFVTNDGSADSIQSVPR